MNCIQKARLNIMYNNLKELYKDLENNKENESEKIKIQVRIKLKNESISKYKKSIGL